MTVQTDSRQTRWRIGIFALTWLAYAGFYLCRKNISIVLPLLHRHFGYSEMDLARVIFGYSLLYSIGQFAAGPLSDRYGPRLIVSIGLVGIIIANVLMGFQTSMVMLAVLACLNGAAQSTGWSGLVKSMACWFPAKVRGVVMAWWGTNYVLGGALATVLATFAVTTGWLMPSLGWRRGFWVPAVILLLIAVPFILFVRDEPADVGLPPVDSGPAGAAAGSVESSWTMLGDLLRDSTLWVIGVMYFLLEMTRYAFMFWLPLYMTQNLHYDIARAGYMSSLYELVGFAGAIIAGYASDRLMGSRRFPVGAIMMGGLAVVTLLHPWMAALGVWGNAIGISLIGIMSYGPDTLMSGAAAQDVGSAQRAATASGVIDGIGHMGSLASPFVVVYVSRHFGWDDLFYVFAAISLLGGAVLTLRWNYLPAHAVAARAERQLAAAETATPA